MEIHLKKELAIKKANIILKMEKYTKREDIAKFLEKEFKDEDNLSKKIKKSLDLKYKILGNDGELNETGLNIRKKGMVWEKKEGEYKISYVEDHVYNKALIIEGIDAFGEIRELDKLYLGKFILQDKTLNTFFGKEKYRFDSIDEIAMEPLNETEKAKFSWKIDENESFVKLEAFDSIEREERKKDLHKFAEKILRSDGYDYDPKLKRMKISYEKGKPFKSFIRNEIEDFEVGNCINAEGAFEEIKIMDLKIMPDSKEDSQKWIDYEMKTFFKERYITPKKLKEKAREIYNKEEFKIYNNEKKDAKTYINETQELLFEAEEDFNEDIFWNIATPYYLNPRKNGNTPLKSKGYKSQEELSLLELAEKLSQGKKIKKIIYSDNHIFSNNISYAKLKYKILREFIKSFGAVDLVVVYTSISKNKTKNKSNYLKILEEKGQIKANIEGIHFKDNNEFEDVHSRNLILITDEENELVYTFDRSIDFLKYEDQENFNKKTKGYSKGFTISKNLKEKLDNVLQSEMKKI